MKPIVEIETSFEKREDAVHMAELLLDEKLVACAMVTNAITSMYEWENTRCQVQEFLLRAKTRPSLEQQCFDLINKRHPYKLPMITSFIRKASVEYADWVELCTKGDALK